MNYEQIQKEYAGLDIIPLRPFSKKPLVKGWQTKSPQEQWATANPHSNYGVRTGNGVIIFDADNKKTEIKLAEIFPNATVMKTFSGGRHFYIKVDDIKSFITAYPQQSMKMQNGYKGEVRYGKGAYTVIPPSVVKEGNRTGSYEVLNGALDNIPTYKTEDILDIVPFLLRLPLNTTIDGELIPLTKFNMSVDIENMLIALSSAEKGDSYETPWEITYPTRSETEFATVRRLVNMGYSFEDVRAEFNYFQCGHYITKPESYLIGVYNRVVENKVSKAIVNDLQIAYRGVENDPNIPFLPSLVLRTLISRGVQFDKVAPGITKLNITKMTGIQSYKTINEALLWLDNNLNVTATRHDDYYYYDLSGVIKNYENDLSLGAGCEGDAKGNTKVNQVSLKSFEKLDHELHYEYKLGETRYVIMGLLRESSYTAKQLARKLKMTVQNIYYHMNKLFKEGLVDRVNHVYGLISGDSHILFDVAQKVENTAYIITRKLDLWLEYLTENKIGKDGARALTGTRVGFRVKQKQKRDNRLKNIVPAVEVSLPY